MPQRQHPRVWRCDIETGVGDDPNTKGEQPCPRQQPEAKANERGKHRSSS
jgi:hypothetical protein